MVKVLIAEDEIPLLRGIKIMIENFSLEFQVVKCAHNGKEAIEYMKSNPVDVIFTDINMPLEDGIAVMDFANLKYPEVIKVVISGYSDFKYAQKAIQCGVMEYILKPILKEKLETILHCILQTYQANIIKKQKETFTDVIYLGKNRTQKEKLQIVYFCAGPIMGENMEESVEECNFWRDNDVEKIAANLLPEAISVYSFEKKQANERILLIVSKKEVDLEHFSNRFLQHMEEQGIQLTVAFHHTKIEINQILVTSGSLRRKIQDHIFFAESSVIPDYKEDKEVEDIVPDDYFYYLKKDLSTVKIELLLKEVEGFFKTRKILQIDCTKILYRILKTMMGQTEQQRGRTDQIEEMIGNLILYSRNIEQLFLNLREVLYEKKVVQKEESTENLMEKVEKYIKENMTDPITAATLASKFGLVAPYLSKLFKEYSNYTLSQYIQKVRLERAKKLLELEGEILAKDVAELVGYSNPLYFSKIFKKKIGLYPSEYRREKRQEKEKKEVKVEI